ncbi:polysaccharide ABC transporter ATP-binding protein [Rhodoferax sp. BLA1]|uniref:ABC transporter ATP-binding protein n=1 Tax=Rhodoferax sp. BLA1 TaxID=2576062 RepID=UPI0015D391C1|nr:polysaccharide ABC transporter ATP-binding protein [Rhodoferax sp. BLA1]
MNKVIEVQSLSKSYKLYSSKTDRGLDLFLPFGKSRHKDFHALKDINFTVNEGESIGIIGRNGSGKSTLLKILSGVLTQTTGDVHVSGKVASLLELGAGFNPELTGRENIYFNGALMGCNKAQMHQRITEIISFADIGDFIDQPVKVYSSGMFVRLAFAASVHVDPDILIIDEALAVGDVRFQKKCVDFMKKFKESGKTILFVSHDIFTVKSFCNRLILINDGKLEAIGNPDDVANRYYQLMFPKAEKASLLSENKAPMLTLDNSSLQEKYRLEIEFDLDSSQWGHGAAWINRMRVGGIREPNIFNWDDSIEIEMVCQWNSDEILRICTEHSVLPNMLMGFRFENAQGWVIANFASSMLEDDAFQFDLEHNSECIIRCRISPMKLAAGHYFITPSLAIGTQDQLFPVKEYTNLIHLYCDTSTAVLGQMRLDYSIELLELV